MKNIILSFSILLSLNVISQTATWTKLTSGTNAHFISVYAKSEQTCYVAGVSGIIRATYDGGVTWSTVTSGTSKSLYQIQFTNEKMGYAVGDNATGLKTINGGSSWSAMSVTSSTNVSFRAMHFPSSSTGFIGGGTSSNVGYLFKTTSGGTTWSQVTIPSSGAIYGIKFQDSLKGYYTAWNGKIFKTTNGGTTWTNQTLFTSQLNDIYISGGNNEIVVGRSGIIKKSLNRPKINTPF